MMLLFFVKDNDDELVMKKNVIAALNQSWITKKNIRNRVFLIFLVNKTIF